MIKIAAKMAIIPMTKPHGICTELDRAWFGNRVELWFGDRVEFWFGDRVELWFVERV